MNRFPSCAMCEKKSYVRLQREPIGLCPGFMYLCKEHFEAIETTLMATIVGEDQKSIIPIGND